ncbi:DNA-binding protein [Bacteroidia bacterium]|nr:DNA-binding protein [Bacteroidia bacterium]GHT67291.1 DNA-binding protein [Bacteroidia bacterium]
MERLSKKLNEIGKDLKSLINTNDVLDKDEKMLDNTDLCFMFHVSKRTLQRYRSDGILPYARFGQKIYYKADDVRSFVKEHCDYRTFQKFEKDNPPEKSKFSGNNIARRFCSFR